MKKHGQKKEETEAAENQEYRFPEEAELKECRYCQVMIPKTAKVCPNCRKRQKRNPAGFFLLLFLIAACGAGVYYYLSVYLPVYKTGVGEAVESVKVMEEEESGQLTETVQNVEGEQSEEAKQNAESGKTAETEQSAESGKAAETEQNAENGKTAETEQDAENGQSVEAEWNAESGQSAGTMQSDENGTYGGTVVPVDSLLDIQPFAEKEDETEKESEAGTVDEAEKESEAGIVDEAEKESEAGIADEAEKESKAGTADESGKKSKTGYADEAEKELKAGTADESEKESKNGKSDAPEKESKNGNRFEPETENEIENDSEDEKENDTDQKEDDRKVLLENTDNVDAEIVIIDVTEVSDYTEEEFRSLCRRVDYKKLLRSQETYLNAAVMEELTVMEQVDGGLFDENIYYLCRREDGQGITRYYIVRDDREENDTPILAGDVIQVYGQLFGSCKLPGYLVKEQPLVPALTLVYFDLLEE